jgi:hypothetical protein
MGSPRDRSDLQSVIDFFATPLIVDVLREIRDGRLPRQSPDLCAYGDAVDAAILALTDAGTVAGSTDPGQPNNAPSLSLTSKGRMVCALIDEIVDFHSRKRPARQPERTRAGWPTERSFR